MNYAANIFRDWYVAHIHRSDCSHVTSLAPKYESIADALYGSASDPDVQIARAAKCCLAPVRIVVIDLDHGTLPISP